MPRRRAYPIMSRTACHSAFCTFAGATRIWLKRSICFFIISRLLSSLPAVLFQLLTIIASHRVKHARAINSVDSSTQPPSSAKASMLNGLNRWTRDL